ncbi:ATP-binding cassette domain-containing protein [Cohaesibacter sp. ES.047]|uniref:ATP-binding cassette domain-containing protein n=1 Tax=Cohaesibacter sp. ES.047 TaxID=1798205 RepID=UPI0015608EAB|nr:sugar ABC transporter ATP-binding protein [Cohaesibacter sp. ES.047]
MANNTNAKKLLVRVENLIKTYGPTVALSGVNLMMPPGEVLGIVGHNGAGKSTLMRALCGIENPTSGVVEINGQAKRKKNGFRGVRMSFQEGSLALELMVKENILLSSVQWMPKWRWHKPAADLVMERLDEIFPDHTIAATDFVDDLPLADRQMVEISRATITDDLSLLILDEPTESLSGSAVDYLYDYVRKLRSEGMGIILVSHRLSEILSVSDRVAVMKDGAIVSVHTARDVTERDLFMAMGGEVTKVQEASRTQSLDDDRPFSVRVPMQDVNGRPAELYAKKGDVIGLAGIVGQGQQDVLSRLWRRRNDDVTVSAKGIAYVPGDRQRFGIFPLWDVAANLIISAQSGLAKNGVRQVDKEKALVTKWVDMLKIRGGAKAQITGLSGGNQQKVIVARAFASEADTILLDDPFRGVDIHTKSELYQLIRSEAERGRTIIWFSSENSEMQHCDRAYVLRAGRVAGELQGTDITDEHIIAMSFAEAEEARA